MNQSIQARMQEPFYYGRGDVTVTTLFLLYDNMELTGAALLLRDMLPTFSFVFISVEQLRCLRSSTNHGGTVLHNSKLCCSPTPLQGGKRTEGRHTRL